MFDEVDMEEQVELAEPHDKYSFLQGFIACARLFGTWNNGEIVLGSSNVRQIKEASIKYCEKEFGTKVEL